METNTKTATVICASQYAIVWPFVIHLCTNKAYRPKNNHHGYPSISFRRRKLGIDQKVEVHRILAFQKYGDRIFGDGIEVRHLDNDKTNFRSENILIGTSLDNYLDKTDDTKQRTNRILAQFSYNRRSFSGDDVINIMKDRDNGMSYRNLASKYRSSKCSIWLLVNGKTYGELTGRGARPHC